MPDTPAKPMTATERKELRRIIARRFELLEQDLNSRKKAISNKIKADLEKSKAADVAAYEKKLEALFNKAAKLDAEARELDKAMRKDGLTAASPRYGRAGTENWQLATTSMTINVARRVHVADLDKHVQEACAELYKEHGAASLDLHKMQLQIEEQLAIGALVSEEAQSFLDRIPQADNLLPPAEEVKALPTSG